MLWLVVSRALPFELQRQRIDAVAQPVGPWAIVEDVAQMAAAVSADHFGAAHDIGEVVLFCQQFGIQRLREAGPATFGDEFIFRSE